MIKLSARQILATLLILWVIAPTNAVWRYGSACKIQNQELDSSLNYHPQTAAQDTPNIAVYIVKDSSNSVTGAGKIQPQLVNGANQGIYSYTASATDMSAGSIAFYFQSSRANSYFRPVYVRTDYLQDTLNAIYTTAQSRASAASLTSCSLLVNTKSQFDSTKWTGAKAAFIDKAISRTVDTATYTNARANGLTNMLSYTVTRAGYLDSLDNKISSRMATFTYTAPNNQFDSLKYTGALAAKLNVNIDKKLSLLTDTTHWGALRALRIDNYISSRQPKSATK